MAAPMRNSIVLLSSISILSAVTIYYLYANFRCRKRKKSTTGLTDQILNLGPGHLKPPPKQREIKSSISSPEWNVTETNSNKLSWEEARILASCISIHQTDPGKKQAALITIANQAAFTHNHAVLHNAGCLQQLSMLIKAYCLGLTLSSNESRLDSVEQQLDGGQILLALRAINNLSLNESALPVLSDCIPDIMLLATDSRCHLPLRLGALEALTNLSVTSTCHLRFVTRMGAMRSVVDCVDHSDEKISLQAIKLIVNLSSNPAITPYLLNTSIGEKLLVHINGQSQDELSLLRWLYIFRNILSSDIGRRLFSKCEQLTNSTRIGKGLQPSIISKLEALLDERNEEIVEISRGIIKILTELV